MARAADVLRLRGFRLLHGIDLPLQRVRLRPDQAAPARGGGHDQPDAGQHDGRPAGGDAGGAGPDRPDRHAACRRRDPGRPRRGQGRRALHPVHHEHLLHRGCGGEHRQALLVSALRHARPRLHRQADRPRQGGGLLGAGADAGPPDPGPAPQGHPQRAVHPAEADHRQHPGHGDQAALVDQHAADPPPHLPQHRRPCHRGQQPVVAVLLDGGAVRPDAELGRRAPHQGPLGRQADPEGHPRSRGRRDGGGHRRRRADRVEPWRAAAGRRDFLHLGLAGHRRGGGRPHRGADGRRHPLRPGRGQGAGAGRQGHFHRPRLPLWAGGRRRGRRGPVPGDHPQGDGRDHGDVRPARHPAGDLQHPGGKAEFRGLTGGGCLRPGRRDGTAWNRLRRMFHLPPAEGSGGAAAHRAGVEVGILLVLVDGPGEDALRPRRLRLGDDGGDQFRAGRAAFADGAGQVVVELGDGDGRRILRAGRPQRFLLRLHLPTVPRGVAGGPKAGDEAEPFGQPAHGGGIARGDQPLDLLGHQHPQRGQAQCGLAVQRLPLPPNPVTEILGAVISAPQGGAAAPHGARDLKEAVAACQHAGGHDPLFLMELRTGNQRAFGRGRRLFGPAGELVVGEAAGIEGHGEAPRHQRGRSVAVKANPVPYRPSSPRRRGSRELRDEAAGTAGFPPARE
ncbi:hypothetical protein Lal_00013691 [Lupinus albus]|nr:hypothetical protein Lal_00013662 [Lupinus albus]KAF1852293.1 hypothetical protein Lal_00013691 [Lupinus albus]